MKILMWNLFLAFIWAFAVGRFGLVNLAFGFVVGYAILWLAQGVTGPSPYFLKVRQTARFLGFFLWELVLANLLVALDVLTPDSPRWRLLAPFAFSLSPAVIRIPLEAKTDDEITILANFITMTPGSLSLDVSEDRRYLYVHALLLRRPGVPLEQQVEAARQQIKDGFERRLLKVLR